MKGTCLWCLLRNEPCKRHAVVRHFPFNSTWKSGLPLLLTSVFLPSVTMWPKAATFPGRPVPTRPSTIQNATVRPFTSQHSSDIGLMAFFHTPWLKSTRPYSTHVVWQLQVLDQQWGSRRFKSQGGCWLLDIVGCYRLSKSTLQGRCEGKVVCVPYI